MLTAGAGLLLLAIRVLLRILPFKTTLRLIDALSALPPEKTPFDPERARRIASAVGAMAERLPGTRCLPQALAARCLLGWYRLPCRLQIGVAKTETGTLEAHAWVESGGAVLVGGVDSLNRFSPLQDEAMAGTKTDDVSG
jgi:hypothetical protein